MFLALFCLSKPQAPAPYLAQVHAASRACRGCACYVGPMLLVTKAPLWPCMPYICVLWVLLSLPLRPGTCLLGSPARTSPSPAATVPSELGTKVGGLSQPGHSPHTAVVILDCAVPSGGWHTVLLGASVPGSPSSQFRASHLLCAACPPRLLSTLAHPWDPSYCLLPSPSWCEGTKQPPPTA